MSNQYEMVTEALHWLVQNQHAQPQLSELAGRFGLSEAHVQRTFQDFAGVSPKQFLKYLTKKEALSRLKSGQDVLQTALDCGLSGPGRLHDLIVSTEALTPGEARQRGAGVSMQYGNGQTPFGPALIAWTERGITFLGFCRNRNFTQALDELRGQWPASDFTEHSAGAQPLLDNIFEDAESQPPRVWLRGSPFQLKVWEALLAIPEGTHCTYGQIASCLGRPQASRAVGTAIGRNPVSWLIPCHRVITSMGTLGGYRWGTDTKQAMIGVEAARQAQAAVA